MNANKMYALYNIRKFANEPRHDFTTFDVILFANTSERWQVKEYKRVKMRLQCAILKKIRTIYVINKSTIILIVYAYNGINIDKF